MALQVSPDVLVAIWQALNAPVPKPSKLETTWAKLAASGWITDIGFEDALLMLDRRLDAFGLKPEALAGILDLSFRAVFARPASRFDDPTGYYSLSAPDVGAVLILLERLGFAVDPEPLCARLRPELSKASHLTWQEIDVLFHEKSAQRTAPLTLSTEAHDWRGMNTKRLKTPKGYRIEYVCGDDGSPLWLTAKSPRYRPRPEPKLTTCTLCGMSYVKGLPSDDREHRSTHRRRLAVIEPKPNRQFRDAMDKDALRAPWVDERSAKWKRDLVYRRAFAFKRELGYDFVQWSLDATHDPEAVGFLFSDDNGRVVGASVFRPQEGEMRPWRLAWIWIAPGHRRAGHLDRHWEQFRQRFGEFDIEPPVSTAMQAFLHKRGLAHLLLASALPGGTG